MANGYDLTLHGLLRKRGELSSQVELAQAQLSALITDMGRIDAAIRVFRPDIDLADLPERIAPAPFTGFRGEIQRFLLDELRKANHALSTFDLADKVIEKRGIDPLDAVLRLLIRKRTGYALSRLRRAGRVASHRLHRAAPLEWCVVLTQHGTE